MSKLESYDTGYVTRLTLWAKLVVCLVLLCVFSVVALVLLYCVKIRKEKRADIQAKKKEMENQHEIDLQFVTNKADQSNIQRTEDDHFSNYTSPVPLNQLGTSTIKDNNMV